jgi:hypothetical protein
MASTFSLKGSFEVVGPLKGTKGTPTRGIKAISTDVHGAIVGEIKDYSSPGSVTSAPNGVQNI